MARPVIEQITVRLDTDSTVPVIVPALVNGTLNRILGYKESAFNAQAVVTVAIRLPGGSFVNVTGGVLTFPTAGAAADEVIAIPTALNRLVPGSLIRATSDGVPAAASLASLTFEIYNLKPFVDG